MWLARCRGHVAASYRQNVPEGLHDRSPTPQGLRRDRMRLVAQVQGFGCAVVCEGDLARSAWDSAPQTSRPVGYGVIGAGVRTDSMTGPM